MQYQTNTAMLFSVSNKRKTNSPASAGLAGPAVFGLDKARAW